MIAHVSPRQASLHPSFRVTGTDTDGKASVLAVGGRRGRRGEGAQTFFFFSKYKRNFSLSAGLSLSTMFLYCCAIHRVEAT